MTHKHLHRDTIISLLKKAAFGRKAWDKIKKTQWASDDFHLLGLGVGRLADERDSARRSQQRMHKKVRQLTEELGATRSALSSQIAMYAELEMLSARSSIVVRGLRTHWGILDEPERH